MRLSFAEHGIEFQSWKSETELLQHISSCDLGGVLLGQDGGQNSEFYSVTLFMEMGRPGVRRFALGICSERHGLVPHLLLKPESQLILSGNNKEVVGFDTRERAIAFRHTCDALFYTFVDLAKKGSILVIHEIGALALTQSGQALWSYSKDIVTGWRVEDDKLYLDFMDSPSVGLALSTGAVMK